MEYTLDGYCGLFCGACPVLLGTKAGTGSESCHGCKSPQPAGHCSVCGIRLCAREKGFAFCGECQELAACEKMKEFMADPKWPYHQGVLSNFSVIRKKGKAEWEKEQEMRWRCANCQMPHSWWDETCKTCGAAVSSYKADL
jgi:hypothetical protein